MTTFLPPLQGVSLSLAEAEAASIAPVGRIMLDTFELWHVNFDIPARIVNDTVDFDGTLEADAPRDAGETVTFTAVGISAVWPSETDDASSPQGQLAINGVSSILVEQLDLAIDSLDPVTVIWRRYASDDPSGPSRDKQLHFELVNVRVTETRVTGTCQAGDAANTRFPARAYTRARYPGLSAR